MRDLEAETGQATGWKQCGSVLVARTPERVALFKRIASAAKAQGVACEMISVKEAADSYPIMRTDDLVGALWLPLDGKVNPADVTQALAKGARMGGAKIFEQTRVTAIHAKNGSGHRRIDRAKATSKPEYVVNCAGQWAKQVGRLAASRCRCIRPSTCTS